MRVGELQSTGDTLGALGLLTVGTDRLNLALKLVTVSPHPFRLGLGE